MLITPKTLPHIVNKAVEECGFETQYQVAKELNLNKAFLYRVTHGQYKNGVQLSTLNELFDALEVTELEACAWAAEHLKLPQWQKLNGLLVKYNELFKD